MTLFVQGPRPRRKGSSFRRRIASEREYYYSLATILAVKIVLFVFLWVLFASSIRVMRSGFKGISEAWRFAMPAFVAAVALYIGYHIVKNIKEILARRRDLPPKP